ncbi:hypothetical protein B5E41_29205 [Rhizobium esperanzae]|uniref:Uncharacterized protein n=1 Tax=Rhizobium esperanzae TaxID=1967781 RepID=A0A246DNS8_9HYPH|nr:hypothetical protein [Rhizobium esperanzae]OWO90007.1 hypothetical protein B5E41_29205 [Rhizobium esperanzae]
MDQQQGNPIIQEALTNIREMRTLAGELEVLGYRTFSTPGLDVVPGDCVRQLREALDALDLTQKKIKAAGRALYVINTPKLAMTADAA